MKDPFYPPPPWLYKATQPFARLCNFPTLPLHIHEVLASAVFYQLIFWPISPMLSKVFFTKHYSKLSRSKRLNWDTHVVSMVQSLLINGLALWVMWADDERNSMDWEERIWGYTGAAAFIQALGAGYFVWDLFVTSTNFDVFGPGTLAHAIAALVVYSMGFRPFVNYYSTTFIVWELSTPFLNVHWFMDKVDMTGSKPQLYNGFLLLGSFFSVRLVYGTYQSYRVFTDIFAAVNQHPSALKLAQSPLMKYVAPQSTVPAWLASMYLAANLTLNFLNFYWFFKMISAVRKRFVPVKEETKQESEKPIAEVGIQLPTYGTGIEVVDGKARPRKA